MNLSDNQQTFLALLRAGLWEDSGSMESWNQGVTEAVDWGEVYRLAAEQSVLGLVLAGIERYKNLNPALHLDQKQLLQWIGEVQMIEQQNKAMNDFIAKLVEMMRKADIYTLLVKGQGIAQCYERPLWRASGDVDLFLSDENYRKAQKLLKPLASSIDEEGVKNMHLGLTIGGFEVELHGTLYSGLSSCIENTLDEIKKSVFYEGKVRSWANGNTQVFLLAADEDVVYVFTHILQHFYKGGIGIRQVCDWCRLLWTYKDTLNLGLLKSRIKKLGLMSEWKAFGTFAVEYLECLLMQCHFILLMQSGRRKQKKYVTLYLKLETWDIKGI